MNLHDLQEIMSSFHEDNSNIFKLPKVFFAEQGLHFHFSVPWRFFLFIRIDVKLCLIFKFTVKQNLFALPVAACLQVIGVSIIIGKATRNIVYTLYFILVNFMEVVVCIFNHFSSIIYLKRLSI